ncbi:IucA/IucC family protein [Yinghuangia seranimata]|uniref:IucA/IucC family protein n=1 Tax=Yinghuangia seranimata TaxID=408067 RepID=UPI00248AD22B|nr:IucA/IucC family protein [Yinghuangia seranimata]MDI2132150.1 IucA/IucC family protein [Yinghuangia seranimata]
MPLPDFPELTGPAWQRASAALLLSVLSEYAYEGLLLPLPDEEAGDERPDPDRVVRYRLELAGHVVYSFRARRGAFGSWRVQPGSVLRVADGSAAPATDPARLIVDARATLGLTAEATAGLVADVTAALLGAARDEARGLPTAAELADLPYLDLEGRVDGHPGLAPGRSRPGFSASDATRWAPEARNPIRLPWAAVHRDIAVWGSASPELTEQRLLAEELDPSTRRRFTARLRDRGVDPADYLWLPVHPWQWDETVLPLFAADLAHGRIVPLGDGGPDRYLPRQAGGGFTNLDRPGRRDVALPLAGPDAPLGTRLPAPARPSPETTGWLVDRYHADPFLHGETRVVLLADLASVTVRHPHLDAVPGDGDGGHDATAAGHPYRGLFGALWSEPLAARLEPGERARPLPALLHRDHTGRPLVAELVERSGLAPREWLRWFGAALLPPLLHLLYRYGLAVPGYGEALVVVSDAGEVPVRLAVRDAARGLMVCGDPAGRPFPETEGLPPAGPKGPVATHPPDEVARTLGGGLFGGPLRHLSQLADDELGVSETAFWALMRAEAARYQQRFPELKERYALFDLLGPRIARYTPNRDRLPRQRAAPVPPTASPLSGPVG